MLSKKNGFFQKRAITPKVYTYTHTHIFLFKMNTFMGNLKYKTCNHKSSETMLAKDFANNFASSF